MEERRIGQGGEEGPRHHCLAQLPQQHRRDIRKKEADKSQ